MENNQVYLKNTCEVWEKVPDFHNYEVSSFGRIKALNFMNKGYEIILQPSYSDNRLHFTAINDNGERKVIQLAYVVAEIFIHNPNKDKLKYVQFRDGDTTNCNVTNLFWSCRRKMNSPYIYVYDNDGELLKQFESAFDAADYFECSYQAIDNCCKRGGTCQGFYMTYEYIDKEDFNKIHNPKGEMLTIPLFNLKTLHKTYGFRNLTVSIDPLCIPFNRISKGKQSEALQPKVKRVGENTIKEVSMKLSGFKGKNASVRFVSQGNNIYEVSIDYPNGATIMVAHCKYSFSTQSEFMVCAEALDSLYRQIVTKNSIFVKDIFVDEFVIGRTVR